MAYARDFITLKRDLLMSLKEYVAFILHNASDYDIEEDSYREVAWSDILLSYNWVPEPVCVCGMG